MCCSYGYGFSTSKADNFFTLFPSILAPSPQIRSHPVPRISFPIHQAPLRPLRSRVRSAGTALQDTASVSGAFSFYDLLGIPETVSQLEIKQAYKQLARKYHPDVSPPNRVEEYTQRFILVHEAYETLSDPKRRALYDKDMAKGLYLAFTARRRYQNDDDQMVEKSSWKSNWQNQVSELNRSSMSKDAGSMSWGARMRRQNNVSSSS